MKRSVLFGAMVLLAGVSSANAQPVTSTTAPRNEELERAGQLLKDGRVDDAYKLIEELVKKKPDASPPRLILARIALKALPTHARALFEQAAAETPNHPEVLITFGDLDLSEGRVHDAILNGTKALEQITAQQFAPEQKLSFTRLSRALLANAFESRRDWANVRTHLTGWLDVEPKNGVARQRLGHVLFQLGQLDDALREFQTAAIDDSNLLPAHVMVAREYMARNDVNKANEHFQKAVTLEPKSARVHLSFADFLLQRDEVEGAKLHTEEAGRLEANHPDLKQMQGLIARYTRDYAAAERIFQDMVTASPANIPASLQLAMVLAESSDPAQRKRGLEIAEAAYRQQRNNLEVLSTLGYLNFRNNNIEQARKIFTGILNAVRGTPAPDTAYFIALLCADDKQSADEAKAMLKRALETKMNFFFRKEATELYRRLDQNSPTEKPK